MQFVNARHDFLDGVRPDQAAPYVAKRYIGLRFVNTGAIATASYYGAMVKNAQSPRTAGLVKSGFGIA